MPSPINQDVVRAKIKEFLTHLDTGEQIPNVGHCEGFVFLLFRAQLIRKEKAFFDRLHIIANLSDANLKKMAETLSAYKKALDAVSNDKERQKGYKAAIAACGTDKNKIDEVREEFVAENKQLALEICFAASKDSAQDVKKMIEYSEELYAFTNMLMFVQAPYKAAHLTDRQDKYTSPSDYSNKKGKYVDQRDYADKLNVVMPDRLMGSDANSVIRKELSFSFIFRKDELNNFFTKHVKEGDLIRIGSTDHVMYLTRKDGVIYNLYDSNYNTGEANFATAQLLTDDVIKQFFTNYDSQDEFVPISMDIYRSSDSAKVVRPTASSLIKDIFTDRNKKEFELHRRVVNNAGLEDQSWDNYTALSFAAREGNSEVVRDLIHTRKADLSVITGNGDSVLFCAIKSGDNATFKLVFDEYVKHKLPINITKPSGFTTMMTVINDGTYEMLEAILLQDEKISKNPNTAAIGKGKEFGYAIMYNRADMADLLFEHGFVPDVLTWKILRNHVADMISVSPSTVLKFMLLYPVDKDVEKESVIKAEHFETLMNAFNKLFKEAKPNERFHLLEQLFNCHEKFKVGLSLADHGELLRHVVMYGDAACLDLLNTNGIDMYGDTTDNSSLHIAAMAGNRATYNALLAVGLDPAAKNKAGKTATELFPPPTALVKGGIFKAANDAAIEQKSLAKTANVHKPDAPGAS